MHDAPSVSYPVGRCRFAGGLLAGTWLLGGLALLAWAFAAGMNTRIGVGLSVWGFCGTWAAVAWWRSPAGVLAWDGAGWRFGAEEAGAPRPALDLQRVLLLQLRTGPRSLWLWVERDKAPSDWDALRRAVYSRARTAEPQGVAPPTATP